MADGLPASSAANSYDSLICWAVAPLGPPCHRAPPASYSRPPSTGWAPLRPAVGGSYHSASPESIGDLQALKRGRIDPFRRVKCRLGPNRLRRDVRVVSPYVLHQPLMSQVIVRQLFVFYDDLRNGHRVVV
jgi:hypothetical protein